MPENTNSMLGTLRRLRKMKDPEGYIRQLSERRNGLKSNVSQDWSDASENFYLKDRLKLQEEEFEKLKTLCLVKDISYITVIFILSYFASLHFFS